MATFCEYMLPLCAENLTSQVQNQLLLQTSITEQLFSLIRYTAALHFNLFMLNSFTTANEFDVNIPKQKKLGKLCTML